MRHVIDEIEQIQMTFVWRIWFTISSFLFNLVVIYCLDKFDNYRENQAKLELDRLMGQDGTGNKFHVQ